MKWMLSFYPPAWRRRYRKEVESHLEVEPFRIRTFVDLLAGAIDAWSNPKWTPLVNATSGDTSMIKAARCRSADVSSREAAHSAVLMIGITFVLTAIGVTLDKTFGDHVAIEALLYSAFFIALTLSSRKTYLKPYSKLASGSIMTLTCIGWYLFFLAVGLLGAAI